MCSTVGEAPHLLPRRNREGTGPPLRASVLPRMSRFGLCGFVVLSMLVGCSGDESPSLQVDDGRQVGSTLGDAEVSPSTGGGSRTVDTDEAAGSTLDAAADATSIAIDRESPGRSVDRRLLGTNVAAWLGPDGLADPEFRALTAASGTTLLRLPGGSWSNFYDWLGCEMGDTETCFWPWAAKPSDFLEFVEALDVPAMWTVSINGTAQEAAALVAFFNGDPADERVIGPDARGRDWETVGTWAQLRVDRGFADPVRVDYWEIGNEIFAATQHTGGEECASFGWEEVWTCDGATYVDGDGVNDGFTEFRESMVAVDPTIQVGAVGVPDGDSWGNWGTEVLERVGDGLDFYVIHHYAFGGGVAPTEVVQRATNDWAQIVDAVDQSAVGVGLDGAPPIAVTEYNVAANQDEDSDAVMAGQLGAIYVALSIGEMAEADVGIANHWNLANGQADNGTDYGMIDVESGRRNPAYYALALWSRFGEELVDVDVELGSESGVAGVFAGRRTDGTATLMLVNASETPEVITIDPGGAASVTADVVTAPSLTSPEVAYNGSVDPSTSLDEPSQQLGIVEDQLLYELAGASIALLTLKYHGEPGNSVEG